MGKKLYVGNLSYDVDSSVLGESFHSPRHCGDAQIIADRDTGRSKGFGFVEMSSDANAGRDPRSMARTRAAAITVNEAKPKENRSGGGGGGGSRGGYGGGGGGGNRSGGGGGGRGRY